MLWQVVGAIVPSIITVAVGICAYMSHRLDRIDAAQDELRDRLTRLEASQGGWDGRERRQRPQARRGW